MRTKFDVRYHMGVSLYAVHIIQVYRLGILTLDRGSADCGRTSLQSSNFFSVQHDNWLLGSTILVFFRSFASPPCLVIATPTPQFRHEVHRLRGALHISTSHRQRDLVWSGLPYVVWFQAETRFKRWLGMSGGGLGFAHSLYVCYVSRANPVPFTR